MIDLNREEVISLSEAPKRLPGRPHISTLYRWAQRRNRPLETLKLGGRVYTSVEALTRFAEQRNGPSSTSANAEPSASLARAEALLDAAGITASSGRAKDADR